jgi:hypothetical protein
MLPCFTRTTHTGWGVNVRQCLRVRHTDDPYAYVIYIYIYTCCRKETDDGMIHDGLDNIWSHNRYPTGVCHNVSVLGSPLLLPSIITRYTNMPHSDAMFFRTTPKGCMLVGRTTMPHNVTLSRSGTRGLKLIFCDVS